jgi:hypothetical protein
MQRAIAVVVLSFTLGAAPEMARGDHFDDHQLAVLKSALTRSGLKKSPRFSLIDLAGHPRTVQGAPQSVLVVVRTDEGNWSKLLVRAGGIKRKGSPQPKSFLHIERLVTYSADPKRGVLADKRDVYLFDGFAIDLDLGQVVRKGDGEDLSFEAKASAEKAVGKEMMEGDAPKLGPLEGTAIASQGVDVFIPQAPLVPASKVGNRTRTTGAITAADFVGKYRLDVDGRFTGVLKLRSEGGKLIGDFASDQTGAVYQASGSLGVPPQQMTLTIAFPRTDLKLDGRLFTRSRTKIAGTATMEENAFGFVAERVD